MKRGSFAREILIAFGFGLILSAILTFCLWAYLQTKPRHAMATPEFSDSGVSREQSLLVASMFRASQERLRQMVLKPKGGTSKSREFHRARAAELVQQV